MKVELEFYWGSQEGGDAKYMRYLQRRIKDMVVESGQEREKCFLVNKAIGVGALKSTSTLGIVSTLRYNLLYLLSF